MRKLWRILRRRWKFVASIVVLLWLAFIFGLSDILILGPRPGKIDAGPARRESISVNGRVVEAWVARSPRLASVEKPVGYVLEFCGNATRAEQIAQYVAQRWHRLPVEA